MKKKIFIFSILFFVVDQISKLVLNNVLVLGKSYTIINNFLYITKVYNEGVSFSMFSGHRLLIIFVSLMIMIFLYFYMQKFKENTKNMIAFSMVFGGLFGNLLDRVIYGYVIDFIDFYIIGYNYPTFNLADKFIFIGVAILLYSIFLGEDNENSSRK